MLCVAEGLFHQVFCFAPLYSKVSRPDKLAVHVFEVDEDVDKDEVSLFSVNSTCRLTDVRSTSLIYLDIVSTPVILLFLKVACGLPNWNC